MEGIVTAIESVLGLVPTVVATITGEPLLLFCLALGLYKPVMGVFRTAKKTAN